MTFTIDAGVDVAVRGTTSLLIAISDGNDGTTNQYTAGQHFTLEFEGDPAKRFVITNTNSNGPVTGTVLTATTVIDGLTAAGAINEGAIAIGVNRSNVTQGAMLTELKNAIEGPTGFGATFFDTSVLSGVGDGAQSLTLTVNGRDINDFSEDIPDFSALVNKNPTSDNLHNKRYENWVALLDDDATLSAELASRMELDDQSTPFNVTNAEYLTKFIPGLKTYKKKVK